MAAIEPARSFDAWAAEYDRYRPGYPDTLFDEIAIRLALPEQPDVVDLGAGTGRATLSMAARGWSVTAVEPGRPMLDVLRTRAADDGLMVATTEARAEETGLDPSTADLVTVAQAFHWFDARAALVEVARLLRPGGGLALFWNVRDEERSPFIADYHALLQRRFGDADTGRYIQAGRPSGRERTEQALKESQAFTDITFGHVRHVIEMTAEAFLGMAFTVSYVRSLPASEQDGFRQELGVLLASHGLTELPFSVPYRIDLWTARRSDR